MITYGTSEDFAKKREKEFLALTPSKRVELFLEMVQQHAILYPSDNKESKGNFIIQ